MYQKEKISLGYTSMHIFILPLGNFSTKVRNPSTRHLRPHNKTYYK